MSQMGFIKMHRKFQEHWLWQEERKFSKSEAWIHMLFKANFKENKITLGRELITVKRGQFITSELKLMEAFGWGKGKLRDFLKMLEDDGMIVKESDRKKTTITICNYDVYHEITDENGPQTDHKRTDNGLIMDTEKKEKKVKKEKDIKNNSAKEKEAALQKEFDQFWDLYPKKQDKKKAFLKFKVQRKEYDFEDIMKGTLAYIHKCTVEGTEKQYIKLATTFLNGECFTELHEVNSSKPKRQAKGVDIETLKAGLNFDE